MDHRRKDLTRAWNTTAPNPPAPNSPPLYRIDKCPACGELAVEPFQDAFECQACGEVFGCQEPND